MRNPGISPDLCPFSEGAAPIPEAPAHARAGQGDRRDQLAHREATFLRIVEKSVYGGRASPYRALLRLAGCEFGDLKPLGERDASTGR